MKLAAVTYAITKQVRQYEPVRVEVTIEQTGSDDTPAKMFAAARELAENAIIEAMQRGPII